MSNPVKVLFIISWQDRYSSDSSVSLGFYFHKVGIAPVNGVCSTDIVVVTAHMPRWSAYVFACVSSSGFVGYTSQTSTGTKMPRTSWHRMSQYELCRPADASATAFQHVVSPMLDRIVANVYESRTFVRRTIVQIQRLSPEPALTCARLEPLLSGHCQVLPVAKSASAILDAVEGTRETLSKETSRTGR